jgi:hypothetical protein
MTQRSNRRPVKRDVLINVRVTAAEREEFATVLSMRNETASDVLRRAMLSYVRRHSDTAGKR